MSTVETMAFIDERDEEVARLVAGERIFHIPLVLLPADAQEGQWLRLSATLVAESSGGQEDRDWRRRLGRSDPGGPIKL